MTEQLANLAQTTLAAPIGAPEAGTSETVQVTVVTRFPTEGNFRINLGGGELGLVTAISGVNWTVTRGIESSTPIAHPVGQIVTGVLTAGSLHEAFDAKGAAASAQSSAESKSDVKGAAASAQSAAETASIPTGQKGAAGGVPTLDSEEHLTLSQVPPSALLDTRGTTAGDLLLFNGSSFVRLPKGADGQQIMVRSDGTVAYVQPVVIEMSAWKAVGDGATDNTTLFKEALATAEALTTGGDGKSVTLKFGGGNFITAPQELPQRVTVEGIGMATTLTQKAKTSGHLLMNKQEAEVSAQACQVRNLRLNGAKAQQEAGAWNCGLVFANLTANAPYEYQDSWHVAHNVIIENFPGDGYVQYGHGSVNVSDVSSWFNDGFGFNLHVDSNYTNCIAGASGLCGFLIQSGSNRLVACKSYYSGRQLVHSRSENKTPLPTVSAPAANAWDGGEITGGLIFSLANGWGNGFTWRHITGTTVEGNTGGGDYLITAQDNARAGIYLNASAHHNIVCTADSNNNNGTSNGTAEGEPAGKYAGVELANFSNYNTIRGVSWTRGANLNQQAAALAISECHGNDINLNFSSQGTGGVNVGGASNMPPLGTGSIVLENKISFNSQGGVSTHPFIASFTPDPFRAETWVMTLTENIAVNAPELTTGTNNLTGIYMPIGMRQRFVWTQDATGGRKVTYGGVYSGAFLAVNEEKEKVTTHEFVFNGTKWVQVGSNAILAEAIVSGMIAGGAVTEAKLGAEAVATGKIKKEAVTAEKIAPEGVTEGKIATGAVTEGKLGSEAVGAGKIAGGAVTESKLGAEAVAGGKIKSGAVTETKIAEHAVVLAKLATVVSKQIPAEHGRSAAMVAGKITIAAPAVTSTGTIIISCEGTTMTVGAVVTSRTAGTGFTVEAAATSTDIINWAVYTE